MTLSGLFGGFWRTFFGTFMDYFGDLTFWRLLELSWDFFLTSLGHFWTFLKKLKKLSIQFFDLSWIFGDFSDFFLDYFGIFLRLFWTFLLFRKLFSKLSNFFKTFPWNIINARIVNQFNAIMSVHKCRGFIGFRG